MQALRIVYYITLKFFPSEYSLIVLSDMIIANAYVLAGTVVLNLALTVKSTTAELDSSEDCQLTSNTKSGYKSL